MTSAQDTRTGLSSLAPELILRIAALAEPRSQVALACAARYFSDCCDHQFRRHRAAHGKYRVSSDLDPSTVPHLVRSALGHADPLDAWHVRSFELWGTRESWDEWRPFNVEASTPSSTLQDGEPLPWSFLGGETEELTGLFTEMPEEHRASAQDELRDGKDGFLKAALLALLPRLVEVRIVSGASEASLSWLANAVQWGKRGASWPPGFAGVRDLAVGMLSGTWRDEHRERLSAFTLASVLQLPRLESLCFSGLEVLEDEGDDDEVVNWGHDLAQVTQSMPPAGSLPLRRLVLDNVDNVEDDFRSALLAAPRALEAFSVRPIRNPVGADERTLGDTDLFASDLAKFQSKSVRRLMFYHPERLQGYRCNAFYPEELDPCRGLRQVCLCVEDIELQTLSTSKDCPGRDDFTRLFLKIFPKTLEVLVLHGDTGVHVEGEESHAEILDEAVAQLIRRGRLPSLKAVFLEQVETSGSEERRHILFEKSMAEGHKRGVDVYTRTNRAERRHDLELLAPLGRYDLLSGPHGRKGKEGLVLDVHTGEWAPPGCSACGRCEPCLEVYAPELWDTIRPEGEKRD